jgi:DNA-binding NarL/FixJ family response regulator
MPTRVLLVDDNELVLSALATMLRHHHDVSVAHNIDGALELAARERFDAIVTDLDFGDGEGRDGYWLLDEADTRWGLRGLVLTGHHGEHVRHRVLRKPVGLESLRAEIALVIGK